MKKLPIGIQDFRNIRTDDYLYVDKTEEIHALITSGKYYFLSRPRRFGKSLLLSTIKEIFSNSKELFSNLWIENQWDWSKKHPVLNFSFSSIGHRETDLQTALLQMLQDAAKVHHVSLESQVVSQQFKELILKTSQKGKVVLLIDEYDKPLIDYLDDAPKALANQSLLRSFFSIIKDSDPYLEFVFITGVSKFSKVSIFSDLNNLEDISLRSYGATLLGYTNREVKENFATHIQLVSKKLNISTAFLLEKIRRWYNGYSWNGKDFLYNPFSVMSLFKYAEFANYWFETGTPSFLVKLAHQQHFYDIDEEVVGRVAFESYNVEDLEVLPILFQTGYLTIKNYNPDFQLYTLSYPNKEVQDAMLQHLIGAYSHGEASKSAFINYRLYQALANRDNEEVINIINQLFKNIPYQIFITNKEAYYHSLVYLLFKYLGTQIESEISTVDGRIDAVVKTLQHIYIIEFKLDASAKVAMQQIKTKDYPAKYRDLMEQKIIALAINFSSEEKQVDDWLVEEL